MSYKYIVGMALCEVDYYIQDAAPMSTGLPSSVYVTSSEKSCLMD